MAFLRFILPRRHADSGFEDGLFGLAYKLCEDPGVNGEHRRSLRKSLVWLEKHLPTPKRFNRSKSKGYYRRNTRGIAWFRDSAKEYLGRMHEIKMILEANGHPVTMIREERVGYIVYEDEFQVVAEPFSETQTGAT
jgi:hypothetical protein